VKGAASAWWTIDAEDSIGLLRIMIAISYHGSPYNQSNFE